MSPVAAYDAPRILNPFSLEDFCRGLSAGLPTEAMLSPSEPRILIVEDQIILALHVADVIEEFGCEPVGPVSSVSAALPIALHDPLDAALLDIYLIDQTVKPIADILRRRGIAFAFMTAFTRLHLPETHRERPFLCKPFTDQQLRAAIKILIGEEGQ